MGGLLPVRANVRDTVVVGALRFTSSGPVFLARDRGHFAAEGIDVDITFFEAAPSIAVAVTAGDLTFGATALTGAFFNLASRGGLRILAGQAREEKGRSGNLVLVRKSAFEAGLTTLPALFGHPFGLTQFGSPSHYQLGQLARIHGVAMNGIEIRAFQTLPNLVAAIRGGQVTWAIIAPPVASDLIDSADMVALARYSDYGSYQFGVLFANERTIAERTPMVRAFLRSYVRGLKDYAALNEPAADGAHAPRAREVAAIIARYVYPQENPQSAVGKVRESAFYVDPTGWVDVDDIGRQIAWYHEQGLLRADIAPNELLRLDLLP
jgi:NitT/TauT family transport system substrate-binding protein